MCNICESDHLWSPWHAVLSNCSLVHSSPLMLSHPQGRDSKTDWYVYNGYIFNLINNLFPDANRPSSLLCLRAQNSLSIVVTKTVCLCWSSLPTPCFFPLCPSPGQCIVLLLDHTKCIYEMDTVLCMSRLAGTLRRLSNSGKESIEPLFKGLRHLKLYYLLHINNGHDDGQKLGVWF